MEISTNQAISAALQAKSGAANSKIAVALASKQLDVQKSTGDAIVNMLAQATVSPTSPVGQLVDIRV